MKAKNHPYDFTYYALLFFSTAFAGWLWEVTLYLITEHRFINRGVYKGPYLPIYGVGGLLLCLLFRSWGKRPLAVFFSSSLLCTGLEYLTSLYLEARWGMRWWDYGGHFLNIGGRVCLLGAVAFGLGGWALVCVFLPFYEKIYRKLSVKGRNLLCVLLLVAFAADAAWCAMKPNAGEGIASKAEGAFKGL